MSTKALEQLIAGIELETGSSRPLALVHEARRELEAIRNAAAAITKGGDLSDEMMARGLLERIAEEG